MIINIIFEIIQICARFKTKNQNNLIMEEKQEYPYVFQTGRYEGKSLEWAFLNDPMYVSRAIRNAFYKRRNPKNQVTNYLQLAVERLQYKVCKLKVEKMCPICKKEKVQMFLSPDLGKIDDKLICCRNDACRQELMLKRPGSFYAINDFLLVIAYMNKKEANRVIEIFKTTHAFSSLEQIA